MRTETKMMQLILEGAKDERIRLVTLEGSRTNVNIPRDIYQDYDISYFVTDMDALKDNEAWLEIFGKRIFMQKPEAMELFPPELGNWFSYLMLFEDGNRIDLTLIPIEEAEEYFQKGDGLVKVLLDKDSRVKSEIKPIDEAYWIKKPTAREFDDCCNEFWWVATYVAKGLASQYLPKEDWEKLLGTYIQNNKEAMWKALFDCFILFRAYSKTIAKEFNYLYPSYDIAITTYIGTIRDSS